MDFNERFSKLTSEDIDEIKEEIRQGQKNNVTIITLGFIYHLIIIIIFVFLLASICGFFIIRNHVNKNQIVVANDVTTTNVTSTTEKTTTTTTSTTTTNTTTKISTTEQTTTATTTTTELFEPIEEEPIVEDYAPYWDGEVLNSIDGSIMGPSGRETYYNLPMEGVVSIMRNMGFDEENYPYWIREDGVKMLGDYVMCAAELNLRPRGSLIESSVGMALVCDTGGFAYDNPEQLDIAVNW